MLGLMTPSTLEQGMAVFNLEYRFLGPISGNIIDEFFGMDSGSNFDLNGRYALTQDIDLRLHRIRSEKEFVLDLGYTSSVSDTLNILYGVSLFSFKTASSTSRTQNAMPFLSIQMPDALGQLTPVINVAYDGFNKTLGGGIGLDYECIEGLNIIAEYFSTSGVAGSINAMLVGLRISTFGHRFFLSVQNTSQIGLRRQMEGTSTRDLSFGFSIFRLLEF